MHNAVNLLPLSREVAIVNESSQFRIGNFNRNDSGGIGRYFIGREEKAKACLRKIKIFIQTLITGQAAVYTGFIIFEQTVFLRMFTELFDNLLSKVCLIGIHMHNTSQR